MDRSIVEELTGSKNPAQELEGFPATELSKVLLYHAGFEAVKRKHNQRIVYQMVEGSRDLYYEINTVIDNVNKLDDQQEEEDYCKMFNDYQGALATLEALLFDLVDPSYDEMDHESGNLKSLLLAVEMQQTTIIKWQTSVENLHFASREKFISDFRKKLSLAIMREATSALCVVEMEIEDLEVHFQGRPSEAKYKEATMRLRELRSKLHRATEAVKRWAKKVVHFIGGLGRKIAKHKDSQEEKEAEQYTSVATWTTITNILIILVNATDIADEKIALERMGSVDKGLSDAFVSKSELPIFSKLVKLVARVRWPYYSRSVALVRLCCSLGDRYKKSDRYQKEGMDDLFNAAVQKSINAVNEAVKFYDAVDFASLHSHQGSPVGEAFVQAHNAIQTCYERIGAAAVWETQKKTTLKDADAKDEERLKNYIAKLQPQVGTVQEKLVDVTVDVHEGSASGSVIKNFTVRVPRGTRLGAIHWSACHTHLHSDEQQVAERVHAVSCFYMGTTRYSMKCVVEDLGGDLDEYKLQIILQ